MKNWAQMIIMLSGAVLIIAGIAIVVVQLIVDGRPSLAVPSQQLGASINQFNVTTHFVGLELIVVGAVLEIAGFLGARPWKAPEIPG